MLFFRMIFIFILYPTDIFAEVKPYFTPSLQCENGIIKLINKAENTIDVAVYALSNRNIVDALKEAKNRGIKVRILTDRLQASGKSSRVVELFEYGLNIRINTKHKIEHNKFAIFDNKKVVTGSYNWTEAASTKNSENCLFIIKDKAAIRDYIRRFKYLWQVNTKMKSDKWFEKRLQK